MLFELMRSFYTYLALIMPLFFLAGCAKPTLQLIESSDQYYSGGQYAQGQFELISITPVPLVETVEYVCYFTPTTDRLDPQHSWNVYDTERKVTKDGTVFTMYKGGPGAEMSSGAIRASSVYTVRMELSATQFGGRNKQPVDVPWMALYWGRGNAAWPYVSSRSVPFRKVQQTDMTTIWEAEVKGHPMWGGVINRMLVGIDFSPLLNRETPKKFKLTLRKIACVKLSPQMNWEPPRVSE